jgi:hypothetical protein
MLSAMVSTPYDQVTKFSVIALASAGAAGVSAGLGWHPEATATSINATTSTLKKVNLCFIFSSLFFQSELETIFSEEPVDWLPNTSFAKS